jgi:hypothetical protein
MVIIEWYRSLFEDPAMREADPFGYGMGLALGYVIIPMVMVAALVAVAWPVRRR